MSAEPASNAKKMTIIVTKGTLDWAYPPFILSTTGAAMDVDVTMFFTFYGLQLLKKDISHLQISTLGNPGMEMPMMGMHMQMPNLISTIPGVDAACTKMMKNMIKKKGVASVEELRDIALEGDVKMVGCQMTMDLFEWSQDDMIDGIEIGGAATYMGEALESDINLYI
ncbi:MAG: peroxiredoxin family protein [Rhodospirillaceae bacterium]|jgi:peroxiredoxin family protein|nr:peroxiredoxin family protein [Rhodospirillaceae bacterium]